jgi:hypothetical protein
MRRLGGLFAAGGNQVTSSECFWDAAIGLMLQSLYRFIGSAF